MKQTSVLLAAPRNLNYGYDYFHYIAVLYQEGQKERDRSHCPIIKCKINSEYASM